MKENIVQKLTCTCRLINKSFYDVSHFRSPMACYYPLTDNFKSSRKKIAPYSVEALDHILHYALRASPCLSHISLGNP